MHMSPSLVVDVTDRGITVYPDHPEYSAIRDGFPVWSFLHEQPGGVVVLMADEPVDPRGPEGERHAFRRLRFHNPRQAEAISRSFWDEYLDTLLGCARSWREVHSRRRQSLDLAGGEITVRLARMGGSAFEERYHSHAEFCLTSAGVDVVVPGVTSRELKELGNFLINYAHQMDTEPREQARTDP